jgi:hypothetical protein
MWPVQKIKGIQYVQYGKKDIMLPENFIILFLKQLLNPKRGYIRLLSNFYPKQQRSRNTII